MGCSGGGRASWLMDRCSQSFGGLRGEARCWSGKADIRLRGVGRYGGREGGRAGRSPLRLAPT